MSTDQTAIFAILGSALALFVWNRIRFDLVALLALLAVAITGIVPAGKLFDGFGHPAVITVAAVLVISQGLVNGGVIDRLARLLGKVGHRPTLQVLMLTSVVALCSGFINNVGALALLMPVAVWMSREAGRSPSVLLMPLAFGSLLGGTMTLIGTPPNIIIASYREAGPFGMFDFAPVGVAITLAGIGFITLIGWRLTPRRGKADGGDKLFSVGDYVTELRVPEDSSYAGATLHNLLTGADAEDDVVVLALIRDGKRHLAPTTFSVLRGGDLLLVEAGTDALQDFLDNTHLELANVAGAEEDDAGDPEDRGTPPVDSDEPALAEGDVRLLEAVIATESGLIGQTANRLNLREQRGLNIVAVARQGQRLEKRLGDIRFQAGDILLVQGHEQTLRATLQNLGCLPLAERGLRFGQDRNVLLSAGLFLLAIAVIVAGFLSPPVALVACAVVMVLAGVLSHQEAYRAIDWPVIVLLAAMIPVGQALESTGAASLIASWMLELGSRGEPWLVIAIVLAGTMLLSNVVNNAAAAILVAPIALSIASQLTVSSDALLMAVAIGASCAFLTPVGHQSNALVMEPGGYRFGDYWRLGLPLSLLVTLVAVPLILLVWG